MRALYDLGDRLASFNFYEWLARAYSLGASTVVFDIRRIRADKWPLDVSMRRFWSICAPGPALAGLRTEIFDARKVGRARGKDFGKATVGLLIEMLRAGTPLKRFRSTKPSGTERYTVTLRRTQRAPGRNSDEALWRDFAREINARVIPDYDDAPIHLHDRVALYAGAEMNFFVSNGPGMLCCLTEYPCMQFDMKPQRGVAEGSQYPWLLANQRCIWGTPTPESVREEFYHWKSTGTFLERRREDEDERVGEYVEGVAGSGERQHQTG